MKNLFSTTAAIAAAMALASCGTNGEATQGPEAAVSEDTMTADASNPFADAEMQMNEKMMAAMGVNVGDNWAKKMIEHHQGAIDMSRIMLEQNSTPDVEKMAREGIAKQQKDIDDIRKLLKEGAPDQKSAELYRPAMMEMHQKMMAAKGADASETFMRKMLEHHLGAVAMSDVALQNGVSGALRAQVQKTRDENMKEAEMVEAMLSGEPMSAAGQSAPADADAAPAAKPASARPTTAAKAATASPTAKPAPATPGAQATAEPKATPSCAPEHRAAGHC